MAPKATPDINQALSSRRFAQKIEALHDAQANELLYLKLGDFVGRTTRMLGIDTTDIAVGYAAKADNAVERINHPLVASIYQGIGNEQVQEYRAALAALPAMRRDKDYRDVTDALLRASATTHRILEEFPGYERAWQELYDDKLMPVFENMPNLIVGNPTRKRLFEALAAIASGKIPPELEDLRDDLENAHGAFVDGLLEELADHLYGLTQMLSSHSPPPPPSGKGDEPGEDDDTCSGPAGSSASGGGEEGSSDAPTGPQDEDDGEDGGPDDGTDEDDSDAGADDEPGSDPDAEEDDGEGDDEGEDDDSDPFEDLGEYIDQEAQEQDPEDVNAAEELEAPDLPDDIDLEQVAALNSLKADMGLPETVSGTAWVYFEVQTPPNAVHVWRHQMGVYAAEEQKVRRIIDESFRTRTLIERGLRSGRVDQARLYRAAFDDTHLFRQDVIDSVGHMDLIVLIDESGSMHASVKTEGYKPLNVPRAQTTNNGHELIFGKGINALQANRVGVARIMASLLLESSRHLPGFNVEVVGYSSVSSSDLGPLRSVGEAVSKQIQRDTGFAFGGVPMVRQLGTPERPYGMLAATAFSGNADAEGLAYAIDKLRRSNKPKKGIIYLADGHVYDGRDILQDLAKKARQYAIGMHVMNLSGAPLVSNGLEKFPNTQVNSMRDMLKGLQTFLHHVISLG